MKKCTCKGEKMSTITLESNEEVTVSRRGKYTSPPFSMVGNGKKNKNGTSLPLIEILCEFSKAEQFAFLKVVQKLKCLGDSREKHNVCPVLMDSLSSAEQQKFKNGIASLIQKGIVKRSKKEHYMVNPNLILSKEYPTDKALWDAIA